MNKPNKAQASWRNRIVGSGEEAPDQLLANPLNWRVHPQSQQDALEGVLDQVGWVQEVLVNQRTGRLVDGHLRVSLALRRGEKSIPVKYLDLSEEDEALVLATLDPIAALAGADVEKLDELLRSVEAEAPALKELLAKLADEAGSLLPNVEFKEYDEGIENEVEYTECPACGHKWPK